MPAEYYNKNGFEYLIVTDRYFDKMRTGFLPVKEFCRKHKKICVYKAPNL